MGVLAVGYWLFVLVAVNRGGRVRDARPARAYEVMSGLGWRAGLAAVVAAALMLGHGWWALRVVQELHEHVGKGLLALAGCWASGMLLGTCLFWRLGVWCRRAGL